MTARAYIVVDLGFGDSGKGTVVDFLVRHHGAGLVVRWNGGAQAGHRVVAPDGREHVFAQFGAGSFVPGVRTHLGPAFALHPVGMLVESEYLARAGVPDAFARTTIDARALVITPFQQAAGRLRELARGAARHGSCGIGFGEAVGDALAGHDDVVRAGDLGDRVRARRLLARQQERKRAELAGSANADERSVLDDARAVEAVLADWDEFAAVAQIVDPRRAAALVSAQRALVLEGAQGVLIDQDHGFHPHTTWSDCTFAGARAFLAAHGFDGDVERVGVLRAYSTRHGAGPFPTEDDEWSRLLPDAANGPHPWQGGFRAGPLDLVLLRHALAATGGADSLAVTCLDRLAALPRPATCARYEVAAGDESFFGQREGTRLVARPGDLAWQQRLGVALRRVRPVRDPLPDDGTGALLQRVEDAAAVRARILSFGPRATDKRCARE